MSNSQLFVIEDLNKLTPQQLKDQVVKLNQQNNNLLKSHKTETDKLNKQNIQVVKDLMKSKQMNEKAQNQLVKLVESKGKYKQKIQKKDETIKLQEKQIQGLKKDLQDLLQYIENKQQQYKVLEEKHVQMFSDFMHQFKMISNQWIMSQQIRQNMEIDNISGLMSNSTKDTENASARNSYQLSDSQSEFSFGTNQFKRDSDKAQFQLINTSVKSASIPNLMSSFNQMAQSNNPINKQKYSQKYNNIQIPNNTSTMSASLPNQNNNDQSLLSFYNFDQNSQESQLSQNLSDLQAQFLQNTILGAQVQNLNNSGLQAISEESLNSLQSSTIDQVNKSHASGSSGSCKFQNDASVQLLLSNKHDEEGRPPSVSLSQSTNIPSQSAQSLTEQN